MVNKCEEISGWELFQYFDQNGDKKTMRTSKSLKTKEKHIINAMNIAVKALNNSRNVCRKYYVHPSIINSYLDNSIQEYFILADVKLEKNENGLQPNERAIKQLILNFEPQFEH